MALLNVLLALLITLVTLPFTQAQLLTTVPTPTFSATTVVTILEESFYTDFVQAVSTFTAIETIDGTAALAVETEVVIGGIQATDVALSQGYIINNFSDEDYALCWFPTSGNWARLPRVLFYGTIVFALVARAHEWLVAGALAASLTFSGVAAIQMSLQVWTHQMVGELDFFALLGILSTSCIIAMPLLNWSSTIRYLGQSEQDKRVRLNRDRQMREKRQTLHESADDERGGLSAEPPYQSKHQTYGPTRTVIVFWAVLVTIGFLSGFAGLIMIEYNNIDYISIFTKSGVDSIRCVPDNGTLDLSAGQFEGWEQFWVTAEFVAANHCENPCTALPDGLWTLFRAPEKDLATLTATQIDNLLYQSATSHREQRNLEFTNIFYSYMLFGLPIILVQGFFHFLLFRRHSPQEARQRIYLRIVGEEKPNAAHPFVKGFALTLALGSYFFAVLILLLTPFILVLNVVATELFMYIFPQSESNKHVGQWSVAASTLLVLLAAMLCRHEPGAWYFWQETKGALWKSCCRLRRSWRGKKHDAYRVQPDDTELNRPRLHPRASFKSHKAFFKIFADLLGAVRNIFLDIYDYIAWSVKDFLGLFVHEWMLFKIFWKDPAVVHSAAYMYREQPDMPRSRRIVAKSYDNGEPLDETQPYPVMRYELREEYPMKDVSRDGMNTYSIISEIQPVSITEIQRPLLTHTHASGGDMALQSSRSKAFSNRESTANQIHTTSAPQSPLLSPPIPQNSHFYKPVPSQANSPQLATEQMVSKPTTPQSHQFADAPFRPESNPTSIMTSLSNSIAARSRRSDVYSPAPEQMQPTPPIPQQDRFPMPQSSPQPALPRDLPHPPSTFDPNIQHQHPVSQSHIPPSSMRTSNLFSEEEIAYLYQNGTPQIRSLLASRNSIATSSLNPGLSAEARGISGTGRVSYLQIQSGRDLSDTDAWGDQLLLRRDRYGRWVIADAPNAPDLLRTGRISEDDDEVGQVEARPREW